MSVGGTLTASDKPAAAQLLADAFFDNPAHVYIYPDPATRRKKLEWLMRTNLGAQMSVGQSFAERADNGSISAMGFWHSPGAPKASLWTLARHGFFSMPLRDGATAFCRMLFTVEEIEARRLKALGGRESWYLNNMVVARDERGRGLGRKILSGQLSATVRPSGFPASLTTQKVENVSFYNGLGFRVADDEPVIDEAGERFDNWIMIYEPAA